MDYVLRSKDYNGTTRFYFDYSIPIRTLVRLLNHFNVKNITPSIISSESATVKFLDLKQGKSVEISQEYISFFPILQEEDKQKIKEEIYHIIARRSEVYFKSSDENLQAAKIALLKSDFRSSTSLMYYCLHKFMSGRYYKFINKTLEIYDLEIDETDIGHYTSEVFYKNHKDLEKESKELNEDNYVKIMKGNLRKNQLNPFIIAKYDLENSGVEIPVLDTLVNNICKEIFSVDLNSVDSVFFEDYVKTFLSSKENRTQEIQVKAAIAFSYKNLKNAENNKFVWKFYILSLRLYWLRQNADYDYDFEIKVSVRELCLIFSSIEQLCKAIKDIDNEIEMNNIGEGKFPEKIPLENSSKEYTSEVEYYRVDYENNLKFLKSEPKMYMICLHLDGNFSHKETLNTLNMMEQVSNSEKYFSFESADIPMFVNLHISNEGRWTFWIPKGSKRLDLLREEDLLKFFEIFMENFISTSNILERNSNFNLLKAYPKVNKEKDFLSVNSLREANMREKMLNLHYLEKCENIINTFCGWEITNKVDNFDVIMDIKFYSKEPHSSELPIEKFLTNKLFFRDSDDTAVIICFYIYPDNIDLETVDKTARRIATISSKEFKDLDENLIKVAFIPISFSEFEEYGYNEEKGLSVELKESIRSNLNKILYDLISEDKIQIAHQIFDECKDMEMDAWLYATKGLLNFRNIFLENSQALKVGEELYIQAIKEIEISEPENKSAFEMKLFLEKAKFFINRAKDLEKARESIEGFLKIKSIDTDHFWSEGFYKEIRELIELHFPDLVEKIQMDTTFK